MMTHKLTEKQKLFCVEYLCDLNATKACLRAGYKSNYPDTLGHQLLGKTLVKEYLEKQFKARNQRNNIRQDEVLQEAAYLAFSNIADLFNPDGSFIGITELPRSVSGAISEITTRTIHRGNDEATATITKYKFHNKIQAIELLFRHLGLFNGVAETLPEPIQLCESTSQFEQFIEYQKSQGMGAPTKPTDKLKKKTH